MAVEHWLGLTNNLSLVLALFVAQELSVLVFRSRRVPQQLFCGVLGAGICILVMSFPLDLHPGLFFDARSVLISVTALTMGPIPTAVTAAAALIFRVSVGGIGAHTGVGIIASSALIGLAWRRWLYPKPGRWRFLNLCAMGLAVQAAALADILLLPGEIGPAVLRQMLWPQLLIYPAASVLLSILLLRQMELRKYQEQLRQSEEKYRRITEHIPGVAYRCAYDRDWTMSFVSDGCRVLTGYSPDDLIGSRRIAYGELIRPEHRQQVRDGWNRAVEERGVFRGEYGIVTASGGEKWVMETGQPIFGPGGTVESLEGIIIDITQSRKSVEQITHMSFHDFMTDLYNRRKYEQEKERLDREGCVPVSVILADINGVRLVNDAFGYSAGDRMIVETARILQSCCREGDLLARTGGDEFAILLPGADEPATAAVMDAIQAALARHNRDLPESRPGITLSLGYGTKAGAASGLEAAEKEAEEFLRRRKLLERRSFHSEILSSVMAAMLARSQETEEHAQRIADMCAVIGERLSLSRHAQDELRLFSMLHDIGKIGIADRILNKAGPLTEEEWAGMKAHPEIGYRIVGSVSELGSVATYILTHHERWDGKGYPQGLRGGEIPLLSRILAVADAYDAMTSDRIYRKALSRGDAAEEIRKNAGSQFDPEIVRIFLEIAREEENGLRGGSEPSAADVKGERA